MSIQDKKKKWCENNLTQIIKLLKEQFQYSNLDCLKIAKLISEYLFYMHYSSQNWQSHKKYLIYEQYPKYVLKQQYINVLATEHITQNFEKIQKFKTYFRNQFINYLRQQRRNRINKQIKTIDWKVGVILRPKKEEDFFIMIQKNQSALCQFKNYLDQHPCKLLEKLQNLYQTSRQNKVKLYDIFWARNLTVLLKDYLKKHDNFKNQLNKLKTYIKGNNYFDQKKGYQQYKISQRNKLSAQLKKYKQQQILYKSKIQKSFEQLYTFLSSQFSQTANSSPNFGFPKGGKLWFEDLAKTGKRELFQQSQVNIYEIDLTKYKYSDFKNYTDKENNIITMCRLYYVDQHDQINLNYKAKIKAYDVISAQSIQIFKKPISEIKQIISEKMFYDIEQEEWEDILLQNIDRNKMTKRIIYQSIKKLI